MKYWKLPSFRGTGQETWSSGKPLAVGAAEEEVATTVADGTLVTPVGGAAVVEQSVDAKVVGPLAGGAVYGQGLSPLVMPYVDESLHTHHPVAATAGQ